MALEEAVSEADQTLRETGHLIPKPSSLGRKACCDVELGGRILGGQNFMSYNFDYFPSMNWRTNPQKTAIQTCILKIGKNFLVNLQLFLYVSLS